MRRFIFRCVIACLTFLVGTAVTTVFHHRHSAGSCLNGQVIVKPDWEAQSQYSKPASISITRIGSLPVSIDEYRVPSLQFVNEQEGWLAYKDKLWRTRDGGISWKNVFTAQDDNEIREPWIREFQFIDERTGWLIASDKMYRTQDGGDSWKLSFRIANRRFDEDISAFEFLKDGKHGWMVLSLYRPLSEQERKLGLYPHTRYALGDGSQGLYAAIYYTEDGGRNWRRQPSPQDWGYISELHALDSRHAWAAGIAGTFYLKNGRWLYARADETDAEGYELANSLTVAIGAPTYEPISLYFVNPKVGWLINSDGYLGKSIDGGKTWHDVSSVFGSTNDLLPRWNMRVYFSDGSKGVGIDGDGRLIETDDGGVSWEVVDKVNQFSAMYFPDKERGWAVSNEHLFRIQNQGGVR